MNFAVLRAQERGGRATVADAEIFHDVFLFHGLNWRWWAGVLVALGLGALVANRVMRRRRWRRRLQRRRQIRARLHGAPVREIDLRDPPVRPHPSAPPGPSALPQRHMAR